MRFERTTSEILNRKKKAEFTNGIIISHRSARRQMIYASVFNIKNDHWRFQVTRIIFYFITFYWNARGKKKKEIKQTIINGLLLYPFRRVQYTPIE